MLRVEPVKFEVYNEFNELIAKVECQDETCSSVELCVFAHTLESWAELSSAIGKALKQLHPTKPATDVDEDQLKRLRENGSKAWAGVDPQALRESYSVNSA